MDSVRDCGVVFGWARGVGNMQVGVDGTCDTEVTKLGPMRAERRHWRAAEKFLEASILNNIPTKGCFMGIKRGEGEIVTLGGGKRRGGRVKENWTEESSFSAPVPIRPWQFCAFVFQQGHDARPHWWCRPFSFFPRYPNSSPLRCPLAIGVRLGELD